MRAPGRGVGSALLDRFLLDFELDIVCGRLLADFRLLSSNAKNKMPTSPQAEYLRWLM
jgi:hypothetical protein